MIWAWAALGKTPAYALGFKWVQILIGELMILGHERLYYEVFCLKTHLVNHLLHFCLIEIFFFRGFTYVRWWTDSSFVHTWVILLLSLPFITFSLALPLAQCQCHMNVDHRFANHPVNYFFMATSRSSFTSESNIPTARMLPTLVLSF